MRISDWSSDVCSSDRPCIAQPLGPPLYILAQAPLLDDAGVVLAHHRYWLISPPLPHGLTLGTAFHRRLARPDRKTVVEGKCVSVRVDLGGGRINKTKKSKVDKDKTSEANILSN